VIYPTAEDWAYFAGLIDGEGSLQINRRKRQERRSPSYHATLSIANTDRRIIDWLQERWPGYDLRPYTLPSGRTAYRWSVQGDPMRPLLTHVRPWLVAKADQAWVVLEFLAQRTTFPGKRPVSPEELSLREGFALALNYLHRRGTNAA